MANEQAQAFIEQATQSLQNSQFQQALELIEQAIAIEPTVSDPYVLKGICLSQLGQPDAATEAFRKAIMLSPYNAKAYYNLAVHYNALGNKKEACELAREAVGVDPRHAGARQLLSQLEQELMGVINAPAGASGESITPKPSNPHDPLSAPTTPPPSAPPAGPPSTQGNRPTAGIKAEPEQTRPMTPPPSSAGDPYAGQVAKSQFSQQGYTRPGYVEPTSSLPWVEKLGSGWLVIGIIIAMLGLVYWLGSIGASDAIKTAQTTEAVQSFLMGRIAFLVLGLIAAVFSLLWMICDITDRRTSWWWLIPVVIGGCCCSNFIWMPLYMLVGRRR